MAADTLTISNQQISIPGVAGSTTSLDGAVTVDYSTNPPTVVSGSSLTTGNGLVFSSFTGSVVNGNYTLTSSATNTLLGLGATITITYPNTNMAPSSVSTTYQNLLGLGSATTASVAVTSTPAPCFATGTLIRTARGNVAVEDLSVGDLAITASGATRSTTWIGNGTVDCRRHPRPSEVMPVRFAAHAFGEGRPARDLVLSPGHSICVDVLGEVLIPAISLVNGSTVQQIDVEEVTYWHVELESHDILLAENMPAESYLDMANRGFFQAKNGIDSSAGPDVDPSQRTHADFCRPFHASGPVVDAVKAQLRKRAFDSGWTFAREVDLHLVVDGRRFDPVVRGLTARFLVPHSCKDVWLVSPTARPSDILGSQDSRDLGLNLAALRIEDGMSEPRNLAIDDPLLCDGFHGIEGGTHRWTTGRAKLPAALWEGCENGFYLRIDLGDNPLPRWVRPSTERPAETRPALALVA